jgi:hypothetical protein
VVLHYMNGGGSGMAKFECATCPHCHYQFAQASDTTMMQARKARR